MAPVPRGRPTCPKSPPAPITFPFFNYEPTRANNGVKGEGLSRVSFGNFGLIKSSSIFRLSSLMLLLWPPPPPPPSCVPISFYVFLLFFCLISLLLSVRSDSDTRLYRLISGIGISDPVRCCFNHFVLRTPFPCCFGNLSFWGTTFVTQPRYNLLFFIPGSRRVQGYVVFEGRYVTGISIFSRLYYYQDYKR